MASKFSQWLPKKLPFRKILIFMATVIVLYTCYDYQRRIATFQYNLTPTEKETLNELVEVFLSIAEKEKLTYFLYAGSLLGSYRHHDIIPWDDDIDVMIPKSQAELLKNAMVNLSGDYQLFTDLLPWKIFKVKSPNIGFFNGFVKYANFPWKYPFIDIFIYEDQGNALRDTSLWANDYLFFKDDVFPLTTRPFFGRMMNTPKRTERILNIMYRIQMCETTDRIHNTEVRSLWQASTKCDHLHKFFPFVHRHRTDKGINETVKIDNRVISWWLEQVET